MFAWLTEETKSLWTFIVVILTFLILISGMVVGFVKSTKRKRIKRSLVVFIKNGNTIRARCNNSQQLPSEKEVLAWAEEASAFLKKKLGDDYTERFYNNDDLPVYYADVHHAETIKIQSFMRARIIRLQQFLTELN